MIVTAVLDFRSIGVRTFTERLSVALAELGVGGALHSLEHGALDGIAGDPVALSRNLAFVAHDSGEPEARPPGDLAAMA